MSTPTDDGLLGSGASVWAEIVREVEARGDPREGPRTLAYDDLVERFLSLEAEVVALRARVSGYLDELSLASSSSTRPVEETARSSPVRVVIARNNGPGSPELGTDRVTWSGANRAACPRGCGAVVRRDNLARHLNRCAGASSSLLSSTPPDE